MSFHMSFVARSVDDARTKLAQHTAPAAVKAVIESALDTMALPQPSAASTASGVNSSSSPKQQANWQIGFFGVSIEASGHVGGGYASISKLEVRPLVA